MKITIEEALSSVSESQSIDFKQQYDPSNKGMMEVIKDIVAIANSGGGAVIFGLKDNGEPSNVEVDNFLSLDPSDLTNKIAKYTKKQFGDFTIERAKKNEATVAVILIGEVALPLIFVDPGAYEDTDKKQKEIWARGTVYFRHGAKSETANNDDLKLSFEKLLEKYRGEWFATMRQVVEAPLGATVHIYKPGTEGNKPVFLSNDPNAEVVGMVDIDVTHPFRQKEFLRTINKDLTDLPKLTSHDVICIKKVFSLSSNIKYCKTPLFSSPRYSQALVDSVIKKYRADSDFIVKVKSAYKDDTIFSFDD